MIAPVAAGGSNSSPPGAGLYTSYFFFLGFFTSFFGLLSFATEILPYGVDYTRM
jgi:hypothetical protein